MGLLTVEIICPSTSRSYDYRIPPKMKISEAVKKILEDIRVFEGIPELFTSETDMGLYCCDRLLMDGELCFADYGVKSGDRLMIV